jgi:hypothetical protein
MPQETNLNVSPYFDDFDIDKNYFKVLFKPGYPVQARELTTLQSILQNQIEQFGSHTFKEGSVVIPGNLIYKNDLNSVILENNYQGLPSSYYLSSLRGLKIKGQVSGVTAIIEEFLEAGNGVQNTTLFVKYLSPDIRDNSEIRFLNSENLLFDEDLLVTDPKTIDDDDPREIEIKKGQGFATTVSQNCTAIGSAVYLEEGIYFIRGFFVQVPTSILYLEPYSNKPSYKVGLRIFEDIIDSYDDETLNDNAQGFSNYAAPGADRFSVFTKLEKLPLDSTDLDNFISLLEVKEGKLSNITNKPQYNILAQELARRTYDESGDYYVNAPIVIPQETLNDLKGNDGIFTENQLTYDNNQPSEELGTYNISPLKAYVRGFEIETIGPTFFDFQKPRATKTLEDQSVNYYTGPSFTLNRVYGSPIIGINTSYYVSLRDSRVGASSTVAPGNEIGLARVYDFALESGSYALSNQNENQWDISLYDIQTYTIITLNENVTLTIPTHVRGKASGATGFLRYAVTDSKELTIYNVKGRFSLGEKLIFDGIENTRTVKKLRIYSTDDVKSLYGSVGSSYIFSGDTIQKPATLLSQITISGVSTSGICSVTSTEEFFVGIATVGNLVSFSRPGLTINTFAKIETVSEKTLTISGITTVPGICDGALPATTLSPTNFTILKTLLRPSRDNTLYTPLPKSNVKEVNLSESNLSIRKQFDVVISGNQISEIVANADETFLPYDEERYALIRQDGGTEVLSDEKFTFTNGSRSISIKGLSGSGNAKLIATLRKLNIKSKIKNRNKAKVIIIDKSKFASSGIGGTTLNDGLIYGNYPYGTRVQDEEICLLQPDVTKVHAIIESNDTNNPDLPSIILTDLNGPTNKVGDLLIGEEFIGEKSKAIGIYVEKLNDLKIGFAYVNSSTFEEGEKIRFVDSKITASISILDVGDRNISSQFRLDPNQNSTIYDYSKIVRDVKTKEPTKKLKIVFESAEFSTSDTGDLTTASSYNQFDYADIDTVDGLTRLTDIIDIRPRVSPISPAENIRSPFEFLARTFDRQGNSSPNILASDESLVLTYSFYLPRIDKILLNKNGTFQLKLGIAAESPQPPIINEDALEVATVYLPPYLYNVNDAEVELKEHRRYTMADIGELEDRIEKLEYYTSLSMLEADAESMSIVDENGISRFKSGIFVDNFSTTISQDKSTTVKNCIDIQNSELRPTHYTTSLDLLLGTNSLIGIGASVNTRSDARTDTSLIGSNVRRTGQLVTLNYQEVSYVNQPYSTRAVNVNPYSEDFYTGTIQLFPSSDIWVDQVRLRANTIDIEQAYVETDEQTKVTKSDPQTGFAPVTWNQHENSWVPPTTQTTKPRPEKPVKTPMGSQQPSNNPIKVDKVPPTKTTPPPSKPRPEKGKGTGPKKGKDKVVPKKPTSPDYLIRVHSGAGDGNKGVPMVYGGGNGSKIPNSWKPAAGWYKPSQLPADFIAHGSYQIDQKISKNGITVPVGHVVNGKPATKNTPNILPKPTSKSSGNQGTMSTTPKPTPASMGGSIGKRSDVQLKQNIVLINSALDRLININFNN